MIHIFIGTKAQFIKMAPILKELEKRKTAYNLIDSGQHAEISRELVKVFGLRQPDVYLRRGQGDIISLKEALGWVLRWGLSAIFRPKGVRRQLFRGQGGICLIHGDTLSTLLALFLAKRAGVRVAHVEAGLRSYNIWHPFPEELFRLITMYRADVLFAPSQWAYDNLVRMKVKGKIVNVKGNTIADTIRYALAQNIKPQISAGDYVLVTTHRLETIYSRNRLTQLVEVLLEISAKYKLIFLMHKPTQKQLEMWSLLKKLEDNPQIQLRRLQGYFDFLQLLRGCRFVITDGGTIQEESYHLDVPCLVMRKKTERQEGLGENVYLAEFNRERINYFYRNYPQFKRGGEPCQGISPSQLIVNEILGG